MPLPRPPSPRAFWADLKAFAAGRSKHQWIAAAVAILMPAAIVIGFVVDGRTNIAPGAQIIYVDSWNASRTDAEIIADQKKDQAKLEALKKESQAQFKKIDDTLEKYGF
jgi:hypothetical protein